MLEQHKPGQKATLDCRKDWHLEMMQEINI